MQTKFIKNLLTWYQSNKRSLPWRETNDSYAIWVSEIMLQQTRVETVIDYYQKWLKLYPDVHSLATASEQEVLKAWEGLGYYSRARNLHRTAQIICDKYGGVFPSNRKALESLPGIGRYTSAAITSIAFGVNEAALDGNIRRVMARQFGISEPAHLPPGEKKILELCEQNLPKGKAGEYNQALMELGATICLPKNPHCDQCPVAGKCYAYIHNAQAWLPNLEKKRQAPHYTVVAAVIQENGKVLIARRPAKGLLGGMWEFPGGKQETGETLQECLARGVREELGVRIKVGDKLGVFKHAYTHFSMTLHAFKCNLKAGEPQPIKASEIRWVQPENMQEFPMGKVDRLISRQLAEGNAVQSK